MDKKATLVFLDIFLILSSVLLSLSFNPVISAASLDFLATSAGLSSGIFLAAAFIFLAVSASLVSYFSPSTDRLLVSFIGAALPLPLMLTGIGNFFVRLLLSTLLFLSLLIFAAKVRLEAGEYIRFSVKKVFRPPLGNLAMMFFALFCLGFFFPYRSRIEAEGFKAPEVLIDRVVEIAGQKMIDVVVGQIAATSKLPGTEAVFVEIPEELGEAGLIQTLEQEFGVKIDRVPKNSSDLLLMIKPSLEKKISFEIEKTLAPLTPILPALISLLLFFVLLPFATVGAFVVLPLLSLAFFLLKALELTTTKTTTVESIRPILQD